MERVIGVIGGSGVYQIEGLEEAEWQAIETPWGKPSDEILTGRIDGVKMAFLPRHGRGHVHSPSDVPYQANIDAMKRLGVTDLIAISACGSFREAMAPGDFVIVDQYVDRTSQRPRSFFGSGCVAHVAFAHPTCPTLSAACLTAALDAGIAVHDGGTYLAMEGPQFSTKAESEMHRAWGADLVGMTGMPEAKLAREAELCYAMVAMVTDFDAWHPGHEAVDVAQVIATLTGNAGKAQALVAALPALLGGTHQTCEAGCDHALDHAVMTAPGKRDAGLVAKLDAVAGRVLG